MVLRPLPYAQPERLALVWQSDQPAPEVVAMTASAMLIAVAVLAAALPARRALRVEPAVTLGEE